MSPKMKGLFKGFKYFSQIFVYREQEMQIGYPTDVKHVAHIGWDGDSMNTPSWMNEFKTAPEFSSASLNSFGTPRDKSRDTIASWASEDFKKPKELLQQANDLFVDSPTGRDLPAVPKPGKRKKQKSSPALRTPKQPKSKNLVANAAC